MAEAPPPFSYYGTTREAYIDILTELVKEESPTLYVEDFLYYFNKAISEYMKVRYELYEITQQLTDDLRFWKKEHNADSNIIHTSSFSPAYRHLLSCIIGVKLIKPVRQCNQEVGEVKQYKAIRLSSEVKAAILDDAYLSIQPYRPYFDMMENTIRLFTGEYDVEMIKVVTIVIEFLRPPKNVILTAAQIKAEEDTSEQLEFTRDVGEEINKIALKLILERSSDTRLQTHMGVNQAITDPTIRGGK